MTTETIWERKTPNFTVRLLAEEDETYTIDFDDPDGEIADALADGSMVAYDFTVAVYDRLGNEIGADHLGGSIYADPAEFVDHRAVGRQNREYAAKGETGRCGSYFTDMLKDAIREARQNWNRPRVALRNV